MTVMRVSLVFLLSSSLLAVYTNSFASTRPGAWLQYSRGIPHAPASLLSHQTYDSRCRELLTCLRFSPEPEPEPEPREDNLHLEKLVSICRETLVENNTTQSLLNIIDFGDHWASRNGMQGESVFQVMQKQTTWEKVRGCMADVRIGSTFRGSSHGGTGDGHTDHIHNRDFDSATDAILESVKGIADSRVAMGMLGILSEGLAGIPLRALCALQPAQVSQLCGISAILPPGRLNGFINMISLIQSQARKHSLAGSIDDASIEEIDDESMFEMISPQQISSSSSSSSSSSTPSIPSQPPTPRVLLEELIDVPFSVPEILRSRRSGDGVANPPSPSLDEASADPRSREIAVLLSGGVDSSVALRLLQLQGFAVRAFYLKIWLEDEVAHLNECPWEEDLGYAEEVCAQLGVPLETVSLQKEYWDEVVRYTFDESRRGRTPNPDVMCNSRIKFGMFYDYVGRHYGAVATGHYAQTRRRIHEKDAERNADASVSVSGARGAELERAQPEIVELFTSPDPVKDQTYFLCNLRQDQLAKAVFPIGHLEKHQVRELADYFQLPTRTRKDSQGICFLGKLKFSDFIEHYLGTNPGDIRDHRTGEVMGRHNGLWFHTIGQRKGMGPFLKDGVVNLGPWYVAAKDPIENIVYITNDTSVIDRPRKEFRVSELNWVDSGGSGLGGAATADMARASGALAGIDSKEGAQLLVRIRHGGALVPATVCRQWVHAQDTRQNQPLNQNNYQSHSQSRNRSAPSGLMVPPDTRPESSVSTSDVTDATTDATTATTMSKIASSTATTSPSPAQINDLVEVVHVSLHRRDKAIASGQFAAFYIKSDSDSGCGDGGTVYDLEGSACVCLGAGVIMDTARDEILGDLDVDRHGNADSGGDDNAYDGDT